MVNGFIIKTISEYCYVLFENNTYECKAKGKLRHDNKTPTTGDFVEFEIIDEKNLKGNIVDIKERKNLLYRPRISNIDQVIIITAVKEPNLNTYTLNKYLALIEVLNIKPVLVFAKVDLIKKNDPLYKILDKYKELDYEVFYINNMDNTDLEWVRFKKILIKKTSVFTGQTGAGKSTTLNNIIPNAFQKTQEISKSLNRGKHTTTNNQLFEYKDGFIGDTPGFSSFELKEIDKYQLARSYKIFEQNANECKFNDCLHLNNTPNCKIIEMVNDKKIVDFLYNDYVKIQNELENKRRK